MAFTPEIDAFIKTFVKDLREDNAAIFAGAGMSRSAGFVNWSELLTEIAKEVGLKVELEHDLISLAQFHVNETRSHNRLARAILEEFSDQAEPSRTHEILTQLPIRTFWTTNYDSLIEDSLNKAYKIPDIKHSVSQLNTTRPKRDAVVYKMHGDITDVNHAILYKEQYERYYDTHRPFITALSGDLVSKTFLFIGFSFTDPNLDYVLSRLHTETKRTHYCFMLREADVEGADPEITSYKQRKQYLRVADLKRYGIQTLLLENYGQVPEILEAVARAYRMKTVFISGSAEEFGSWTRVDALAFVHALASGLVKKDCRVVNGFGWGIGSAVINGALEAIYSNPMKHSDDQLVMRPFPQFAESAEALGTLWEEYRQRMISLSGIAIFVFGNKADGDKIIDANGVIREFKIAVERGVVPIPICATGYASKVIFEQIMGSPDDYYRDNDWIIPLIKEIADPVLSVPQLVQKVLGIIQRLTR